MTKEIDHYELTILVVGPDYRDSITIEADDPIDLEFQVVTIGDREFQRYGDDESYDDVRADLVVARRFKTIYKESSPVTPIVGSENALRSLPDMVRRANEVARREEDGGGEHGDAR